MHGSKPVKASVKLLHRCSKSEAADVEKDCCVQAEASSAKESSGTVRPNPRLFQISQAAAVSAARNAHKKAKSRA